MQTDTATLDPTAIAGLKGLPAGRGWTGLSLLEGDLLMPCAVIRTRALDANQRFMAGFLARTGALLCPHGKTTMSPELMQRQMADGAWGITAATWPQARLMHSVGIRRVLMANQLVGRAELGELSRLLHADPGFAFLSLVDSPETVAHMDALLDLPEGVRVDVLVEVGQPGARTGARSREAALATARAVKASRMLRLAGIETYEGILPGTDAEDMRRRIDALYTLTGDVARSCADEDLFAADPVILSGGGSEFFDRAAAELSAMLPGRACRIVLRSGCYLTHDVRWLAEASAAMFARSGELLAGGVRPEPALEVWAAIHSRPEPGLAFANMGKRDVSFDMHLPVPQLWFRPGLHARPQPLQGVRVRELNDQHAHLILDELVDLRVGDLVGFGISHPCTTFDKWTQIPLVDEDYRVTGHIRCCF